MNYHKSSYYLNITLPDLSRPPPRPPPLGGEGEQGWDFNRATGMQPLRGSTEY